MPERVIINLADNQWGNETMQAIAQSYADAFYLAQHASHENPPPLVVTVNEHAGWFLSFYFEATESYYRPQRLAKCISTPALCIGSANDAAVYYGKAKQIRELISCVRNDQWHELPEVFNR